MPQNNHCLIISQSARALAESAARAGVNVHVIDCFSDQDTHEIAQSVRTVDACRGVMDSSRLLAQLNACLSLPIREVVTGSGLEGCDKAVFDFIATHWALRGNMFETVRMCKDPERLFPMLAGLGIPSAGFATVPQASGEWLLKKKSASGGGHVHDYVPGSEVPDDCFLQKKVNGTPASVIFIADGAHDARMIGLNETWSLAPGQGDFRYAGAMALPGVSAACRAGLTEAITALTRSLQLKGLCGLDLVIDDRGDWTLVELNPRPTATFELHETDVSLFAVHLQACLGRLIPAGEPQKLFTSARVIYADKGFEVPDITWPEWVSDRPFNGRLVEAGQPVCTIKAQSGTRAETKRLLQNRLRTLRHLTGMDRLAA